ncbi:MAG: hypothetical protein ABSC88_04075 [Terracidiphilus sp.]|jgi:hypothetical protein
MTLSIETIRATENDAELFDLLATELDRLLPDEVKEDPDRYYQALDSLPRGLRAMAGIYFFNVSMTLDSLSLYFGSHHEERDLRETLNGLRELELTEIADLFEQACKFMEPHMAQLQSGDYGGKEFTDWLVDIGAQKLLDPVDGFIRAHCEKVGELGLLGSWPVYARKYPERCVAAEPQT